MTYQPKPGEIGLTQISGGVGKAIRFGQWLNGDGFADFEHAFVYVGGGEIVEAMPGGAQRVPNWHDPARTRWLICPDSRRQRVAWGAVDLVGTPYSFADYGYLAARRFRIPAPHLRRHIADGGHLICSQLADAVADQAGWHLFADGRWPGDVTPGDLNRLWESLPASQKAGV